MAKIDRASIGPSEFGPANVIVVKQPHGEVLEREGVKLRRVLWLLVVVQVASLAVGVWTLLAVDRAERHAARAAARFQLESPR